MQPAQLPPKMVVGMRLMFVLGAARRTPPQCVVNLKSSVPANTRLQPPPSHKQLIGQSQPPPPPPGHNEHMQSWSGYMTRNWHTNWGFQGGDALFAGLHSVHAFPRSLPSPVLQPFCALRPASGQAAKHDQSLRNRGRGATEIFGEKRGGLVNKPRHGRKQKFRCCTGLDTSCIQIQVHEAFRKSGMCGHRDVQRCLYTAEKCCLGTKPLSKITTAAPSQ